MSYLFQHAETHVMDVVRSVALQNNLTILANIHDAIILKEDISEELLQQIETAMQISTDNPYWKLGKKQLVP
jgi:ABC-type phosphate/phosphonate transport system ATPase subunit